MKKLLILGLSLALAVMLGSCGDKKEPLPETYTEGEDSLPALGMAGDEEEEQQQSLTVTSETDEESGETKYVYTGLSAGGAEAKSYVDQLVQNYGCSVIDDTGTVQAEPDFSAEEGTVLVGKDTESESGIFQVQLQWNQDSCTVSTAILEGLKVAEPEEEGLTTEEAVQAIENSSTQVLGLPGTSMSEYLVYARDGYVMVDDQACFVMDIYDQKHAIQETCLLTLDGKKLYRLDRATQQVTELH
ncbi:MAG TPA: hypothetical protein H9841_08370 [Candidatus Flavonifractor merdigallinarum]|uniref:Prokaryotic membrane lipoprotein lipid attachment site profile n=1 Tax=Candidatus Flavonifractor merdigallinarum TaxID=2838589 RepID=A0A9D1Y901_9FIRM|nr:hypothetical protein [Candidatus Flavonifractor merdigallinarum]